MKGKLSSGVLKYPIPLNTTDIHNSTPYQSTWPACTRRTQKFLRKAISHLLHQNPLQPSSMSPLRKPVCAPAKTPPHRGWLSASIPQVLKAQKVWACSFCLWLPKTACKSHICANVTSGQLLHFTYFLFQVWAYMLCFYSICFFMWACQLQWGWGAGETRQFIQLYFLGND